MLVMSINCKICFCHLMRNERYLKKKYKKDAASVNAEAVF